MPRARARALPFTSRLAIALAIAATCTACAAFVLACNHEGAPPVAPMEATIGAVDASAALSLAPPALPTSSKPAAAEGRCTARLVAEPIQTGAGCELDERISRGPGLLVFPCTGGGEAEAIFQEHRFHGTVEGPTLALTSTTELDWQDGCHWETRQTIRGSVIGGKPTKLVWTYSERPVSGTGCYAACRARAELAADDATH